MTKWEAKQAYADKRNSENAKVETLSEEQHDALATLCSIRHKIHSSGDSMFNTDSSDYDLWDYVDEDINKMLEAAELGMIDFGFAEVCPNGDYFFELECDEKDDWEEKADKLNEESEQPLYHTGYSLWVEESWEHEDFLAIKEKINTAIEEYLAEIDKEHGTNYCPTGFARL